MSNFMPSTLQITTRFASNRRFDMLFVCPLPFLFSAYIAQLAFESQMISEMRIFEDLFTKTTYV